MNTSRQRISETRSDFLFALLMTLLVGCAPVSGEVSPAVDGNSTSSGGPVTPLPTPTPPVAKKFWVEPTSASTIGIGQTIFIFSAYRANLTDSFPVYVDPSLISFSLSSSKSLTLDPAKGSVTGVAEGTTTITATYQGNSTSVDVQVSGSMIKRTISVTGQGARSYYIYVPSFAGAPGPYPLLFSLHGGGGIAMSQAGSSMLNTIAARQKFLVAYPEGTGAIQTFNGGACCGSAQTKNIDDSAAIRAMLADIQANYSVASGAIFASGFSNGSIMSHRLACEVADKFAGVATFSGGSGEFDSNLVRYFTCNPSRPIRIIHFHATNDRNYPIAGGLGDGSSATPFYSIDSTINDWIRRNNVKSVGVTDTPAPNVTCVRYAVTADLSKPSAPVALCTSNPVDVYDPVSDIVFGGGHSWPGGVRSNTSSSDTPMVGFDANTYMWNYLTK